MSEQTLRNRTKALEAGNLAGAGAEVVTSKQMEFSRPRAENKRPQKEFEIGKQGCAATSRKIFCEVRAWMRRLRRHCPLWRYARPYRSV
jgi:hypothetical protein